MGLAGNYAPNESQDGKIAYVLYDTLAFYVHLNMLTKRRTILLSIIIAVLLVPLIAMQFTNEVNWSLGDFVAAATLLLGTGFVFDLIMNKVKAPNLRLVLSIALLLLLLTIWAELAVGIFS